MSWILVGVGILVAVVVFRIINATYIDNKVLTVAASKGFDARYEIDRESSRYLELITLLKQCRARSLTIEQSADTVIEHFN